MRHDVSVVCHGEGFTLIYLLVSIAHDVMKITWSVMKKRKSSILDKPVFNSHDPRLVMIELNTQSRHFDAQYRFQVIFFEHTIIISYTINTFLTCSTGFKQCSLSIHVLYVFVTNSYNFLVK